MKRRGSQLSGSLANLYISSSNANAIFTSVSRTWSIKGFRSNWWIFQRCTGALVAFVTGEETKGGPRTDIQLVEVSRLSPIRASYLIGYVASRGLWRQCLIVLSYVKLAQLANMSSSLDCAHHQADNFHETLNKNVWKSSYKVVFHLSISEPTYNNTFDSMKAFPLSNISWSNPYPMYLYSLQLKWYVYQRSIWLAGWLVGGGRDGDYFSLWKKTIAIRLWILLCN